jgi:hypothetical protein
MCTWEALPGSIPEKPKNPYQERNGGEAPAYFDGLEKPSNGATSKLRMFRGGFSSTLRDEEIGPVGFGG